MPCPNVEKCLCPNVDCERHAHCCICVAYHRDERGNLPQCMRPKPVEEKQ